jgi:predicted metal-dependent phosphoesterase TrpH
VPKADLHVHTRYSAWRHMRFIHPRDCYVEPRQAYERALAVGMDLVAVTDHDSVEGALRLLDAPGVDSHRIIVGEEVECTFPETGQWVHVSVLGLGEEDHRELQRLKGDIRDAVGYCRARGLMHILNHPFQSYFGQKSLQAYIEDILALFTHVEGLNGGVTHLQNRSVRALCAAAAAQGCELTQVGGSDAHTLGRIGKAWTEAEGDTAGAFIESVREGRCRPGGASQGVWGLFFDVERVIGAYYARLYTGRGGSGGATAYAMDLLAATACLPAAFGPFPLAVVALNQARQRAVSRAVSARLSSLDWNGLALASR